MRGAADGENIKQLICALEKMALLCSGGALVISARAFSLVVMISFPFRLIIQIGIYSSYMIAYPSFCNTEHW